MLKHILSDINYLLGKKNNSCSFGGDSGEGVFPLSINTEYSIIWKFKRYTICVISVEGSRRRIKYKVTITKVPDGEFIDDFPIINVIPESEITEPILIGPCEPYTSPLDIFAATAVATSENEKKRKRGKGPQSSLSLLDTLNTVTGAVADIDADGDLGMDPPPQTTWSLSNLSSTHTHSLPSYNNISVGTLLEMYYLPEKIKKGKKEEEEDLYRGYTGIIIGIYQREDEITILILFDDKRLALLNFNVFIFRNKLIHTKGELLLVDYATSAKNKDVKSSEVKKFNSIRGPYINPRNIISHSIDPAFIKNITDKYILNGDIRDGEIKINVDSIDFKKLDKVINDFDDKEYEQFIASRENVIIISLPQETVTNINSFKLAILLDQWKDFIQNDKVKYIGDNRKAQEEILFNKIKEHVPDIKTIIPKNTENIMKELGVASYTLINIYTKLNINQVTWPYISEKFLKALIILTRTKRLYRLNVFNTSSSKEEIIIVLNTILNENGTTGLCIAVDALSGLANFGPLLNAMGNRYSIFMSPVNFADGAISEDTLTKTSLPYGLVDDFSFLRKEIKIEMPGLLDFTFKNSEDEFLKYKLFIEKFGIVGGCGEKEPDPVSGKYTIQNSIKNIEVILEDLKKEPGNIKLIIKDLCEKSSKTIMDMSKSIVFKEYITTRGFQNNYTFYGNDNSSTLFAKYFLKELASVIYLGGSAELAKNGLGKFKIVFTLNEARQLFGLDASGSFPKISNMFDETIIPFTTPNVTIDVVATISASLSGGSGSVSGIQDDDMGVSSGVPKNILSIEEFKPIWDRYRNSRNNSEILEYFKGLFKDNFQNMFDRFIDLIRKRENQFNRIMPYPDERNYNDLIFKPIFDEFFERNYPSAFGKKIKNNILSKIDKDINYLFNLKK